MAVAGSVAVADLARAVAPSDSLVEHAPHLDEDRVVAAVPPRQLLRLFFFPAPARQEVRAVRREEARGERARRVARGKLLGGEDGAEELARDEGGGAVAAVAVEDAEGAYGAPARDGRVRLELGRRRRKMGERKEVSECCCCCCCPSTTFEKLSLSKKKKTHRRDVKVLHREPPPAREREAELDAAVAGPVRKE